MLNYEIDDPVGDHNDFFNRCFTNRAFYKIKLQNGSLYLWNGSCSANCKISAPLSINLYRYCDIAFDDQRWVSFRPWCFRDQLRKTKCFPALLRQMRHHWRDDLQQEYKCFSHSSDPLFAEGLALFYRKLCLQSVCKLIGMGYTAIKP